MHWNDDIVHCKQKHKKKKHRERSDSEGKTLVISDELTEDVSSECIIVCLIINIYHWYQFSFNSLDFPDSPIIFFAAVKFCDICT